MIFWRGWGILVLLVPFAWLFIVFGVLIAQEYYEPDPQKVTVMMYRLGALSLALSTVTLYAVTLYRGRAAPGQDEFSFIPMKYWTYLAAAGAVVTFALSFFPGVI